MIRFPVAAIAWGFLAMAIPSQAQEFRIETELFSNKEKTPFAEHLTLFDNGRVYDFPLVGPEEITVFDYLEGRFVILDTSRRLKTTVAAKDILEFLTKILTEASGEEAPLVHPRFVEEFDPETKWLTLTDKHMVYRAQGIEPADKELSAEYRRFADWYARLNAIRPGNLPPYARLELNKALESRNLVPEKVELTITPRNRLAGKIELASRHIVTWRLLETDRNRIDRVTEYLQKYQSVDYDEFIKRTVETAAAPR
jgi:hypothetical protein